MARVGSTSWEEAAGLHSGFHRLVFCTWYVHEERMVKVPEGEVHQGKARDGRDGGLMMRKTGRTTKKASSRGGLNIPGGCGEEGLEDLQNRIKGTAKGIGASTSGKRAQRLGGSPRRDETHGEETGHLQRSCVKPEESSRQKWVWYRKRRKEEKRPAVTQIMD